MMGHYFRLGSYALVLLGFKRGCDSRMDFLSRLSQQAAICGILNQRMLEMKIVPQRLSIGAHHT